jgi:hypothetical protein
LQRLERQHAELLRTVEVLSRELERRQLGGEVAGAGAQQPGHEPGALAKGTLDGRTYKRCLFHVSPRYLVDDYSPSDPSDDDEHIEINVPDTGVPEWDSGLFADDHELDFPLNQPSNVFARFFAHMLGMADNTETNPLSYQPIVQAVLPGATVEAI